MSPVRAETRTTRLRSSSVSIVYARACKDNQIQIDRQVSGPIEMKMLHQSHCSRVVTLCHISRRFSPEKKYIRFGRSGQKQNTKTTGTLSLPAGWLEVATCRKNSHFKLRRTGPQVVGCSDSEPFRVRPKRLMGSYLSSHPTPHSHQSFVKQHMTTYIAPAVTLS
jgi:hypothetical protein